MDKIIGGLYIALWLVFCVIVFTVTLLLIIRADRADREA